MWADDSSRQPDQLINDEAPSTSHSSQQTSGRAVRRIVPLEVEEKDTPENSSVNLDIFTTKATTSHTDPATGDIIPVRRCDIT